MFLTTKASARRQIQIKAVKDNILVLPGNHYRMVIETSAVNFELKSAAEQDALTETFKHFLNSLPCPVQVVIRVREVDIDKYLAEFSAKYNHETNPTYQSLLTDYGEFVKSLIKGNQILSRRFYLVIPYDPVEHKSDFQLAKEQLRLRRDIVSRGLERLGMNPKTVTSLALLDLFYSFYNPMLSKTQPLTDTTYQLLFRNQDVVTA